MPGEHARLSPSSASRWMTCPGSVHLSERRAKAVESSSIHATEGTQAHQIAEWYAMEALGQIKGSELKRRVRTFQRTEHLEDQTVDEMERHAATWADGLMEFVEAEDGEAHLEQRVTPEVSDCWGTSDGVVVSADTLVVADYKYGRGVSVSPERNHQLMLYACGAAHTLLPKDHDIETVQLAICQPRTPGKAWETWELSFTDLMEWEREANDRAQAVDVEVDVFAPSPSACMWCPVASICVARTKSLLAMLDENDPATLSGDSLAAAFARVPEAKRWASDVEARVRETLTEGRPVPGLALRPGSPRRKLDADASVKVIRQRWPDRLDELAPRAPLTVRQMEAALGDEFDSLGDAVVTSSTAPAVTTDDDPRTAARWKLSKDEMLALLDADTIE